ncbi:MAG: glycoside hydrolase family 31 protein [Chloroflexota bacterium]|nr:glycoside hydrolase family 31 protein [Chloroflexota bacterium]
MRPITLEQLTPDADNPLSFAGSHGELLRIDVLDHDLIRVSVRPDGVARLDRTWTVVGYDGGDTPREGRLRDDLTPFPRPNHAVTRANGTVRVRTDALTLTLDLADARIAWQDADGRAFAADLRHRAYGYDRAGRSVFHYMERRSDEHYFGFGERAGTLDKRGLRMQMKNVDALGYNAETGDPLYKHVPFYITFIPTLQTAYGLFYDNLATAVFDMGREIDAFWGFYRSYQADDGDIDLYLIYGADIPGVVEKFTRLTGRPALPPQWALGYLGSTMTYTEAPDAQAQLKKFVELCQQHDIPCDGFHLSSGYTLDAAGRRNVFTWNRARVPDPAAMVQTFHDGGLRVAANIKPYLLTTHPDYDAVRAAGGFIQDADMDEPASARFWSGGAFESGAGAYIDFTADAGYGWWKARVQAALFAYGIDAAWNDNNEFEIWDDAARCAGFGRAIPISMARPLQTLLMARCSWDAAREHRPDARPFVLTRSGTVGMQRYAQTWSGDNETSWHTLKYNIPMGLGMSLSGIPHIGHDIGGFYGALPDPELFVRWVQNGVFQPRFTIHSWKGGDVNEPWMYPDVLPLVRAAIQFRYRLIPYLYSLAWQAHATGAPLIRPLVYEFPDDPRCATESFDFLLGSHLLVASILEAGARTRRVYLPAGVAWCDWYTGEWHAGGTEIDVAAPLDRCPLFVRDGGIIPLRDQPRDPAAVTAHAFVHHVDGALTLYTDDGDTIGYQRGAYTTLRLTAGRNSAGKITTNAETLHDGYPAPRITFETHR